MDHLHCRRDPAISPVFSRETKNFALEIAYFSELSKIMFCDFYIAEILVICVGNRDSVKILLEFLCKVFFIEFPRNNVSKKDRYLIII